jgi:hypothetical protein
LISSTYRVFLVTLLNTSQYAKHRGVSPGRVSQWVAAGQIKRQRDGKINVEQADKELEQTLDKTKQRKKRGGPALNRNLTQQVSGGNVSESQARTLNLVQKAKLNDFLLKQKEGSLLDKAEVEQAAFDCARQVRDAVVGIVEKKGDEWHMIRNLFEFKLQVRRDLEETLRDAGKDYSGQG